MQLRFVFLIVIVSALALGGCRRQARVAALPTAAPAPAALARSPAAAMSEAETAFNSGDYDAAARAYEDYLALAPAGNRRDEALFRLGLAEVAGTPAESDWPRAATVFQQLVNEHPESPHRSAAALILALHSEITRLHGDEDRRQEQIRQLSDELEKLKRIDAERRQ